MERNHSDDYDCDLLLLVLVRIFSLRIRIHPFFFCSSLSNEFDSV